MPGAGVVILVRGLTRHCGHKMTLLRTLQQQSLEPDLRPVTGSHFARPGKSAAAAAITLSTQGVNEHQIELLE